MKILVDMNLSPLWIAFFDEHNLESIHWSMIGKTDAPDQEIMRWAQQHDYVVFTHDLDFGTILAMTNADGPSVIQVRTQNVHPSHLGLLVISALNQFETWLKSGALITVDETSARARILPMRP